VLCGDLKKAFLQIFVREEDRDVLRFHWVKSLDEPDVFEVLRFTRPLFGLVQSPFILGGTLDVHLAKYPESEVMEIRNSLYVDDLIKGLITAFEGTEFKQLAKKVFSDAGFVLHKWHSNKASLEEERDVPDDSSTFAKETFGSEEGRHTKLLGLPWDKAADSLSVVTPDAESVVVTKRGVLKFLAAIFDPLGFICPVTLVGKCIFRDCCEAKLSWDKLISGELLRRWITFVKNLPHAVAVPRALTTFRESIDFVELHVFGDASKLGTGAVAYAVVHQPSGVSQGLIAAKARISKKTTIPRLELVGGVMCANLLQNVRDVLSKLDGGVKIRREVCWSDSTTAIHWIRGDQSKLKQFVKNHCRKVLEKTSAEMWRHVPGVENPADVASRGSKASDLGDVWWKGPAWLNDDEKWPEDVQTSDTAETAEESKLMKEVLSVAVQEGTDSFSVLVHKFEFKKVVRISAWMKRFVTNICSGGGVLQDGPLTTEEIEGAVNMLVRKTQTSFETDPKFQKHQKQFNLQKDDRGVYICVGRVKGMHPTYLPTYAKFTELLVRNAHLATLHGGVGLTLTKVREQYWVPRLRQLTKRVRTNCYGCKRNQATPLSAPRPSDLPSERTDGDRPFQVIGLDFAGPIPYRKTKISTGKAYIIIYSCSLTRALCVELLPDQTHATFVPSLKRMMAQRGRPEKIYSDNFTTFVSASKWLKNVIRNEHTHDYLATNDIKWQFNMSRAPWWGGQFERMVALVKQAMYKVVGKALLSREELEDVLMDVELCLNNRPLSYVEDDVDFPVLTPNTMMFGQRYNPPEEDADNVSDRDLRKRARFIQRCKEHLWSRWTNEYLRGLREQHDLTHVDRTNTIAVGDILLIKGEQRNRAKWKIGIVEKLISGRDNVVRGAVLRAGRDKLERVVQHLYPMELSCDASRNHRFDPEAKPFTPRVRRQATLKSELRTKEVLKYESTEPEVEF
jgi:hypothetical protein